jgi:Flp pilus assembly pilin Flp
MLDNMPRARILRCLWRGEEGQDLMEYTLMVAALALGSAAIFFGAGGSINVMWVSANSTLHGAASPGGGSPPDTTNHFTPDEGEGGH